MSGRFVSTGLFTLWRDMVYIGILDGRLIALDAMSGAKAWSVQTTPSDRRYTITGAAHSIPVKTGIQSNNPSPSGDTLFTT